MNIITFRKEQLKSLTEFIIEKKLVFHPTISPNGCPDFSNALGKEYILIIDRNIMTKIIELCNVGTLKDPHILKVVSSLLFWTSFNGISITGGLALNEYANNRNSNDQASLENNIFLKMFEQYSPKTWLNLFEEKIHTIPKIDITDSKEYVFDVKSGHHQMHIAEVLHIWYLLMKQDLSPADKMIALLYWIDENSLFCQYTIIYAALLFTKQIKQPKIVKSNSIDVFKKSLNQAWDLTYLSFWSTLYWDEAQGNTVHLFATMDTDLKKIFINTHTLKGDLLDLFVRFFGEKNGTRVLQHYNEIIAHRQRNKITDELISSLIQTETNRLQALLSI